MIAIREPTGAANATVVSCLHSLLKEAHISVNAIESQDGFSLTNLPDS